LIDTPAFRRLAGVSQLGLVGLVYPAANHSRFEHSLGVYRLALLYLRALAGDRRFAEVVGPHDAELLLASALLHDIGHWPFCHPIEDIALPGVPKHESFAATFIHSGEIADVLRVDWKFEPRAVVETLSRAASDDTTRVIQSILSGPIDVDKMDYLMRDSLHAGVPYGRNFDQARLIRSLCMSQDGSALAISEKGKTAAEMMVFARYVMFSEVYWHHGVRAATAMLQRAFYLLHDSLDLDALFRLTEAKLVDQMRGAASGQPAGELLEGLFGSTRSLYKRLVQFSIFENPELYEKLARRPYPWLVRCSEEFLRLASAAIHSPVKAHQVLFDAPPQAREVEFNIEVHYATENVYRRLGDVSPVVQTLARRQFDDYVKRVRIFVHPALAAPLRELTNLPRLLEDAIERVE
jgi:HD superfamily phosphohydrolase